MSKTIISALVATSMFITPLAEAKGGRSFARISPRLNIAKPVPSSAPAVHSNGTTVAQAPTSQIRPPAASTPATSSSAPAVQTATKPVAVAQPAAPNMPQPKVGSQIQPLAPVPSQLPATAPTTLQSAAPVTTRSAPLTVAIPVYQSRPQTKNVEQPSSTMQNIAVGVLGGLGIAMLADSLFGDDDSSDKATDSSVTSSNSSDGSASSLSALLLTAGLAILFLGLVWFTIIEFIRHRRRTRQ